MNASLLSVLIAILSIQSGASLAKHLFPIFGAEGATTLRIFFASLILLFMFKPWKHKVDKPTQKLIWLYGIALGIMNLLFYKALEYLPQGITVALEFTGPLGLSLFLSRKKLDLLWAFLAIAGVYFVLPLQSTDAPISGLGVLLALGAGVCWALYILISQKISTTTLGTRSIALGMSVASLVTLPFGLLQKGKELFHLQELPLMIAVALLSSVIPYTLELSAMKKIPTKTFGILMSLEPAIAALVAYLFLNENLNLLQKFAIIFISIATIGSTLTTQKKKIIKD
jgi:inner membrane transporter RhtA